MVDCRHPCCTVLVAHHQLLAGGADGAATGLWKGVSYKVVARTLESYHHCTPLQQVEEKAGLWLVCGKLGLHDEVICHPTDSTHTVVLTASAEPMSANLLRYIKV